MSVSNPFLLAVDENGLEIQIPTQDTTESKASPLSNLSSPVNTDGDGVDNNTNVADDVAGNVSDDDDVNPPGGTQAPCPPQAASPRLLRGPFNVFGVYRGLTG